MKQEDRYKYFAGMRMRGISKILAWILAVTIVFTATYALILPAITIDADTAAQEPGFVLETDSQEAVPTTELSEGEKDPGDPVSDPGDPISDPADTAEDIVTDAEPEAPVALAGDIEVLETEAGIVDIDTEAALTDNADTDSKDAETIAGEFTDNAETKEISDDSDSLNNTDDANNIAATICISFFF